MRISRIRLALASITTAIALTACETREVDAEGNTVEAEERVSACRPVMFEDTPLTHCTADPALHDIRTALDDANGYPARSFAALALPDPERVAFAMNAGMFDSEGEPIGYYVEDGERRRPLNQAEGPGNFHLLPNGVFLGDREGNWRVLDTERFADEVRDRPDFATQSGPMLVIRGDLHEAINADGDSHKVRNGVGVDPAGRAHFVISEAPLSFGKFARYFRDVLKVEDALFLDGSVSQLWDPVRGRRDVGPLLGPMIVVETKGEDGQ